MQIFHLPYLHVSPIVVVFSFFVIFIYGNWREYIRSTKLFADLFDELRIISLGVYCLEYVCIGILNSLW